MVVRKFNLGQRSLDVLKWPKRNQLNVPEAVAIGPVSAQECSPKNAGKGLAKLRIEAQRFLATDSVPGNCVTEIHRASSDVWTEMPYQGSPLQVAVVLSGILSVEMLSQSQEFVTGEFAILDFSKPSIVRMKAASADEQEALVVVIQIDSVSAICATQFTTSYGTNALEPGNTSEQLFEDVSSILAKAHLFRQDEREVRPELRAVLANALRVSAVHLDFSQMVQKIENKTLQKLLLSIREKSSSKISYDELSQGNGLSKQTLTKLFIDLVEMSPRDFLKQVHVIRTKQLLEEGHCSWCEVSERLGYRSTANMIDEVQTFYEVPLWEGQNPILAHQIDKKQSMVIHPKSIQMSNACQTNQEGLSKRLSFFSWVANKWNRANEKINLI